MLQEAGIIEDWIAEGEARGTVEEARKFALLVLSKRFGELPTTLAARIQKAEATWCELLVSHALEVESWTELKLDN